MKLVSIVGRTNSFYWVIAVEAIFIEDIKPPSRCVGLAADC
jgi:hypothetical protein